MNYKPTQITSKACPYNTLRALLVPKLVLMLVISIESEKYDVSRQRIIALLGKSAAEHYQIQEILKTRHLYVHQGREVEDDSICYEAVMLALSCLLHYTQAAVRFSDKPQFIRYLDMIFRAEQISDGWDAAEQRAFKRLLRHKREPIILPLRALY